MRRLLTSNLTTGFCSRYYASRHKTLCLVCSAFVCVCLYVYLINCPSVKVRDEYRADYDEGRGGYGKSAIRMFEKLGHPEYSAGSRNSM